MVAVWKGQLPSRASGEVGEDESAPEYVEQSWRCQTNVLGVMQAGCYAAMARVVVDGCISKFLGVAPASSGGQLAQALRKLAGPPLALAMALATRALRGPIPPSSSERLHRPSVRMLRRFYIFLWSLAVISAC